MAKAKIPSRPLPDIEPLLSHLPAPLRSQVERNWEQYLQAAAAEGVAVPAHADFLKVLLRVWGCSEFVSRSCIQHPALLAGLLDSGDLLSDYLPSDYRARVARALNKVRNEEQLAATLRQLRRYEMVRIAWRDLAGWARLGETLRDLSLLAEACIEGALLPLEKWLRKEVGTPHSEQGVPQSMLVVGMGKLGARELNFSSDIDLILAFPEHGETRGKRRVLSNEEYFSRLGQGLIHALGANTVDGFVFRTDVRLRPYGDSGPLAMSFDAMEEYYQSQGRDWERYAMIKARVVAGEQGAAQQLQEMLRPFVYRRYLDYGAFESLRGMKALISSQVARKGMQDNIKLGPGGIREIEFIGQAFQLVRGGREPELRVRGIMHVLKLLAEREYLPHYVTDSLLLAYVFLRRVENRLQEFDDQQTHELPRDDTGRLRLAWSMGYADWSEFSLALERHRQTVQGHFEQVFAAPQSEKPGREGAADFSALWREHLEDAQALELLQQAGFGDVHAVLQRIKQLRESHAYRERSEQSRARMDQLMPLLLGAVGGREGADECLFRIMLLLEAIAGRSVYVSLLVENPVALSQVVRLYAASPWIGMLLTRHPVLLDELLDARTLYELLDRRALEHELLQGLQKFDYDDLEQQMEALRYFKQSRVLHVAAADVARAMPLMEVSDHLTEIAEVVLDEVLQIALNALASRHGYPRCSANYDKACTPGFCIIGYGKLGGIELGYGSDLDLVFLHDSRGDQQQTSGKKPIDNAVFFARLGQRIIHILNTLTPSGVLYEVDMRLRPSGASGLLVSDVDAFADYQREEAWTWEHQALVRARPVAGDEGVARQFRALRREVLCRKRDPGELQKEVREMRERMRGELSRGRAGRFDIKQDRGGIADIEFMVQYGVLRWAHEYPDLTEYTDNIRILEGLARNGLMPDEEARFLGDAYRSYRARTHRLALQEEPAVVEGDEFREISERVAAMWRAWLEP